MLDGSRHEDNIPGSNRNNRRVDKGRDFYNRPTELQLQGNGIENYSNHNEGKSVITERFIRTLMNKTYKYTT